MDIIFLIGRIALAALFIFSGSQSHFSQQAIEHAKAKGAPSPETLVPATGVAMIAGGVMISLGIWADVGALILLATLLPITFIMHAFWKMPEGQEQQMEFVNFFKNLQVAGGLIVLFWVFNQGQDLPATLTDSFFDPF